MSRKKMGTPGILPGVLYRMKKIRNIYNHCMKIHPFTLLLLVMGATLLYCGSGGDSDYRVNENTSSRITSVRITNDSSSEIGFNIAVNGKAFYTKDDEIIAEINSMAAEYANEPFYRKLWRYLVKNRYHFDPYTGDVWGHSPVLYLNSIGFGFCDDVAAVYYFLATRAGYQARVWNLNGPDFTTGHVVPEVLVKDHWEMYDPDMEVYYWNEIGQVAKVEELGDFPKLITKPIKPFPVGHFSPLIVTTDIPPVPFAYTQLVADIYSAITHRNLEGFNKQQIDLPKYDQPFSLPPNAYIEFPVPLTEGRKLKSVMGTDVPDYNLMRMVVPKGWFGSIKLPFAFLSIKGSGLISLNNEVFILDRPDIANRLEIDSYISQASINESMTDIEILFLVNKTRFRMDAISSVEVRGDNSNLLSVAYN